jgi:DNA-binding transcriptional MerR regulator
MNTVSTVSNDIAAVAPLPDASGPWVSMQQLSRLSNVDVASLRQLIDFGLLKPAGVSTGSDCYSSQSLAVLKRAAQLRVDLALDSHSFALAFMLSERISGLENELASLKRIYLLYVHPEALDA